MAEKKAVKIMVPSEDPKKEENLEPQDQPKELKDENHGPIEESEEDRLLREKLETNARRLVVGAKIDAKVFEKALKTLSTEIQSATASMTSVPKPLKFLRPFYDDMKKFYEQDALKNPKFQKDLADVLSVMAMTMAQEGSREMLKFKLQGNRTDLGAWGHEFVRALCGEISMEFNSIDTDVVITRADADRLKSELVELSHIIAPFLIKQNTETEAVDLLFEVNQLDFLIRTNLIEKSNYERTCLYLLRFAEFLFELSDLNRVLGVAFQLYLNCDDLPNALRVAMRLNDTNKISQVFASKFGESEEDNALMKRQLGMMLGANKMFAYDEDQDAELLESVNNEDLHSHFQSLALNLNMQDPKSPEDVYKTHLSDVGAFSNKQAQSARANLASTYVNGFVNCGFEKDALLERPSTLEVPAEEKKDDVNWVFRNKDYGKTAAVASLGLINLWSVDVGVNLVYQWLDEEQTDVHCIAGGVLGLGLSTCGVRDQTHAAWSLLEEFFQNHKRKDDKMVQICGVLGMGIGYAGNPKDEVLEFFKNMLSEEHPFETRCLAALAIGLQYIGTGNGEVAADISQYFFSFEDEDYEHPMARYIALGLALIYLGKQDAISLQLEAALAIEHRGMSKLTTVLLESCAYAGSGNVIQVQKLLHMCAEHLNKDGLSPQETSDKNEASESAEEESGSEETEAEGSAASAASPNPVDLNAKPGEKSKGKKVKAAEPPKDEQQIKKDKEQAAQKALHQSVAVIGVALITFGETIGRQMAERTFQHLLQYGDLAIRRAVPLAIALSHISDPDYGLIDLLSKLTHDADKQTSMCAIMAMGLMSAGTTNSKVAQLLRQLAVFYSSDASILFVVRLAQGLLFCGKGLVTLHPFHSDRTLMSQQAVGGILTVLLACFDINNLLLKEYHILMFALACAIRPRMLMTLMPSDGNSKQFQHVKVKVRVGQAVETVGQAGNPKKITGFQTQETPVLLNVGDRVELATDEYEPYTSVLEGLVLLKKVVKTEDAEIKA